MKPISITSLSLVAVLALSGKAVAGDPQILSFKKIWDSARQNSPTLSAVRHDQASAMIAEDRASLHWFPRLYLDARAYGTNDPALSFMSVLDQRQIGPSDFISSALNEPSAHWYEKGTLGLDLPLFEGGSKTAMAGSAQKMRESKGYEKDAASTSLFAGLAGQYAGLLVLSDEREDLGKLRDNVDEILERYSIGSKSNPVGYSGLLGLKSLKNRVAGLAAENLAKTHSIQAGIRAEAKDLPERWVPQTGHGRDFLKKTLPVPASADGPGEPAYVKAVRSGAQALEKMEGAETARLLPRVGIFAEGYLMNGDRAAAESYAGGAYLRWDLFDAPNFGAAGQAGETAKAAKDRAEALSLRSRTERTRARETIQALETNLSLMDDSAKLLEEQTKTARKLFRNGSINALQLVEVLSRRADLLTSRAEAEMGITQAWTELALNTGSAEASLENK